MSNSSFQRTPKEIITTLHRELVSLIVGVAATQLYLRDMTHPARSLSGRMRVGVQKRSDRVSCDPNSGSAAGSAQGWPLGCIIRLFTTMASANFGQPCDLCVQPKCCCDLCVNEYTAFCNGPGCQVSPMIVAPPSLTLLSEAIRGRHTMRLAACADVSGRGCPPVRAAGVAGRVSQLHCSQCRLDRMDGSVGCDLPFQDGA